MDEAFMRRVAERIAAATEAVSSLSPTADPAKLPAVQTMDEWMASHSPGARQRCGDCKAPLVEGSTTICIACGRQLPPRLAVKREPFSFDMSLAKKLFYESVHLEDPHDTSADTAEVPLQATSSGRIANGYSEQQSLSDTGFGVEVAESSVQRDERGEALVSDSGVPAVPGSKPLKDEDEDYIWGSADVDEFGSRAWSQQLTRNSSTGDPQDLSAAINSAAFINAANSKLGQNSSTNEDDFFAVASVAADLSLSRSVDLNIFFPSAFDSVDRTRGEQANTTGASSSKESSDPSVGTNFHDFFQTSPLTDPKVQTSDPHVRGGSTHEIVERNFGDVFQAVPRTSTDQSHRHGEATVSGEQSNAQNLETDFDDFFQGAPKVADHSHGLNADTTAPHTAEESRSQNISTDFDGFFQAVSGPAGHTHRLNLETSAPHTAEESKGQDGRFEADFDDFLQAAPSSTDQFGGSNEQPPNSHLAAGDFIGQREEPHFDFFFQNSSVSTSQSRGPGVGVIAPHSPEKLSGQNLETDFDFFFPAGPVSGDRSRGQDAEAALRRAMGSSGQKTDDHFDFFQVPRTSAEQDHGQNAERAVPMSAVEKNSQGFQTDFEDLFQTVPDSANHGGVKKGEASVPHTADRSSGGHDGETDFDDFFQAAPAPAGPSRAQKIETDFDDFFGATPKPGKGSGVHNGQTDFDFFFQTPKSEDKSHIQHAKSSTSDSLAKSNGQIVEPDFDDFFQAGNNSVSHSHGQKMTTGAPRLATESVGQIEATTFEDFFQAAPSSINRANGHSAAAHPDFFQSAPSVKGVSGQNVSVGFDGFFSPASVDKSSGKNVTKDIDPFLQADPLSVEKSLDQNGATDVDNGDFDDFVQAAPQSADKVSGPSQTTEFDSFFQARSGSVETSQQRLTTDFADFFQIAPRTADKPPNVHTETQFDFLKTSLQSADKSHYRKASADFGDLFQVSLPKTEPFKRSSSASGLSAYGNGSGQNNQAGASSTRSSSSDDFLRQLEGLHLSQGPLQGFPQPPKKMANAFSDSSFRLADHVVLSDEAPTSMWSFN